MLPPNKQIKTAQSMVSTLVHSNFFGELVLKFEAGNIVHIRQVTNAKIGDVHERMTNVGSPTEGS